MSEDHIRGVVRNSVAHSRPHPSIATGRRQRRLGETGNRLVALTLIGLLGVVGGKAAFGNTAPSAPVGGAGNVPEDTRDFLKTLPTKEITLPQGEGFNDAIYKVNNPARIDRSANIKAGVTEMLQQEVLRETGGDLPQAGEQLDVAVVPPMKSIPPEAR